MLVCAMFARKQIKKIPLLGLGKVEFILSTLCFLLCFETLIGPFASSDHRLTTCTRMCVRSMTYVLYCFIKVAN